MDGAPVDLARSQRTTGIGCPVPGGKDGCVCHCNDPSRPLSLSRRETTRKTFRKNRLPRRIGGVSFCGGRFPSRGNRYFINPKAGFQNRKLVRRLNAHKPGSSTLRSRSSTYCRSKVTLARPETSHRAKDSTANVCLMSPVSSPRPAR